MPWKGLPHLISSHCILGVCLQSSPSHAGHAAQQILEAGCSQLRDEQWRWRVSAFFVSAESQNASPHVLWQQVWATSQLKDAGAVAKGTDVENNCTHSWTKHGACCEEKREEFRCVCVCGRERVCVRNCVRWIFQQNKTTVEL